MLFRIKKLLPIKFKDYIKKFILYIKRKVKFFDKILNYGNINPIWLLRLWKRGKGFCDDKLMDEKIIVTDQKTTRLQNIILDDNLNNLTWWTNKHNNYSNREALEILKSKYIVSSYSFKSNYYTIDYFLCLLKVLYNKMPIFFRSFLLFFYSYFLKLGILDGLPGFIWNILQVFWYRYLVDVKVYEFEYLHGFNKEKIKEELFKLDVK